MTVRQEKPCRPPEPRPVAVRYNDWRQVELPAPGAFVPTLPVSVIVPCFEAPEALALTLAGLERQDWPRGLLEVVVVDDGSDPLLTRPARTAPGLKLDLKVIRQERRGFGLARARNTGVCAAAHDILVFLDGDVIPEAGLVSAHARWHHAVSDALTLGFCGCVSAAGIDAGTIRAHRGPLGELFAGRPIDPPWLERHMARTGDLTSRHGDRFRAVTGQNFGISRALFEESGGFDESFTRYGGEDTEFAWRAQVHGALLAPARGAFGWHQGRWAEGREAKERDLARQAEKLAGLIAEPGFRPAPGRCFAVPRYVVTLDVGRDDAGRVIEAAGILLFDSADSADPAGDVGLCIGVPPGQGGDTVRQRLKQEFEKNPRVRIDPPGGALEAFPASPVHIVLPADAVTGASGPGLPARLAAALGDAAAATAVLEDGGEVSITHSWALHRVRRAGGLAADYGDVRRLSARILRGGGIRACRLPWAQPAGAPPRGSARAVLARVWAEVAHVRGPRTLWRFLRWLAAGVRWKLGQGRAWTPPALPARSASSARVDPPPGVAIAALGPRARAVFAASSRVSHTAGEPQPDGLPPEVVLADSADLAAGIRSPAAFLDHAPALAVPAFDPALDNPVGWVRDVEPRAAALGPPALLPPGARVRRAVAPGDRKALRHCHHLEDVAGFHPDPVQRAGTLVRLAARGVPVRLADRDPALAPLLGTELHGLMTGETGAILGADADARETLSIAMRRAALRGHSLGARARQVCEAAGIDPPAWPAVSVLLATRRPALLAHAVRNVARQRYPRLELVLALHGPGFESGAVEHALQGFSQPAKVLWINGERPLGIVLDDAAAAASGPLIAKMDDDDLYGPEHLWDLVLAHEYSGATLVGKFPATVYLAHSNRTLRQRRVPGETWSRSITGGAMLLARTDLARAGGWRPLPRHVDRALVEDVLRTGGTVYRTHDAGYLLVRHGDSHTWQRGDADFLGGAESVHPGWQPGLAGLGNLPPPVSETGP